MLVWWVAGLCVWVVDCLVVNMIYVGYFWIVVCFRWVVCCDVVLSGLCLLCSSCVGGCLLLVVGCMVLFA